MVRSASHRHFDTEGVIARLFKIIGGIACNAVQAGCVVDHAGQTIKANKRAIKGVQIYIRHVMSFSKATHRAPRQCEASYFPDAHDGAPAALPEFRRRA
jgi:hypothetical protein